MSTKQLHALCFAFILASMTNIVSAQWVKQTLPKTVGVPALEYPGANKNAFGKNALWTISRNVDGDTANLGPVESVRTFDGGRTYRMTNLPFTNIGYHYAPQLVNAGTAYIATTSYETGETAVHRSVDSGATWQMLPYHPEGFLNAAIFYDANIGIAILDPDSLGAYFAYTINGGTTFTRLPQTNVPRPRPHEAFFGGSQQVVGDVIFQSSYDTESSDTRIWRSVDRGRNWTAGQWIEEHSPFGPNILFTDKDNGVWLSGNITPNPHAFYTNDGGETWKEGGALPGYPSGGVMSSLPNTSNIVNIFTDTTRRILFSAATNDFGKTWHSKKDLAPYRPDSIYLAGFGIPPFAWTNLDIVDNNTAWAKLSRTELYRYDNATPLIAEKPDLDLIITADNDGLPLWNYVKFTLTIKNRGISKATGIKANWLPPYKRVDNGGEPFANVGAYSSKGNYNWWSGDWDISELAAGESATATFHLFVVKNNQNVTQTAQITACNELDLDSSPNNMVGNTAKEDDETSFTSLRPVALVEPAPKGDPSVSALKISPNPAKDKAFLAINDKTNAAWTIEVVNNLGQVVFSKSEQQNGLLELNTQDFKNGLYLVHLTNGTEKRVEKLMVQH
jgi:hypothetical protein